LNLQLLPNKKEGDEMALPQERLPMIPVPATKEYYLNLLKQSDLWYKELIKDQIIPSTILTIFKKEIIEQYQIIPVAIEVEGNLKRLILVTDYWNENVKELPYFEEIAKMPVKLKMCTSDNIKEGILFHYNLTARLVETPYFQDVDVVVQKEENEFEKSLVFKKIEKIIHTALNKGASDIHLLPGDNGTYVLIKIDGRLINFSKEYPMSESDKSYIVNIVKSMCEPIMDSSNYTMPEDGSFRQRWNQKWIDFRVSTMPTIRGQKVVIRLLDPSKVPLDLDELGFPEEDKILIKKILMIPIGLFFVVGPVGTGKSTTIHAALKPYKRLDHNIITIENPCEYRDELLTQVQIREGAESNNLDGKQIFKASLRQDPKTFFYAETRDAEDAKNLITAALSGHRIVTTLHGIDAIQGLDRLYDMGVEKSALKLINGILAQRLIARNCPHCSELYELSENEKLLLTDQEIEYIESGTPKKGKGCAACNEGFLGRKVIAEIIVFNNEFRDLLFLKPRGITEIQEYLRDKQGFKTIWEKGLDLVKAGEIKLSELIDAFSPNL
jgi:type IV pilus assembly protein PilB